MTSIKTKGLAGIVAGQTQICAVTQDHQLRYRGFSIADLCAYANFEEVAYLLIYGELPTAVALDAFITRLISNQSLPNALKTVLEQIPKNAHPMDVLRTGCSMLGTLEMESATHNAHMTAERLLSAFPSMLMYWYYFSHKGQRIETQTGERRIADHFLQLLQKKVDPKARVVLNMSMILYAEHEFNVSTFTARTVASTLSDFYSAITAAIGALAGPLHGGANEAAMALISSFTSPDEATQGVKKMLAERKLIMGFGHRVYTELDPRSDIMKQQVEKLAEFRNDAHLFLIARAIEKVMWSEKHLFPNIDFYSALAYHFSDIPTTFFTPLFVMSRLTGWTAHIVEQRKDNKLIRPAAEYIGPKARAFVVMDERD